MEASTCHFTTDEIENLVKLARRRSGAVGKRPGAGLSGEGLWGRNLDIGNDI